MTTPRSAGPPIGTCSRPRTLIYRLTSLIERLPLTALFPCSRPIEIELGSGDGSFLVACAQRHPDRNFLGVERLLGRLRKTDRKGLRAGLDNLRLIRIEAAYLVEHLLPPASVQTLHICFPDPWPKRKHWSRRLIQDRFPEWARRALVPGGMVYLRTDDAEYFAQMQAVFAARAGFHAVETPAGLAQQLTDFEQEFQARGLRTLHAAYQTDPGQSPVPP